MPQLDFFFFFCQFFSFFFFFGGFFVFQTVTLPFLLSFLKLRSNRIYYYFFFFLFLSTKNVSFLFIDLFYHLFQIVFLFNKLTLINSITYFSSDRFL